MVINILLSILLKYRSIGQERIKSIDLIKNFTYENILFFFTFFLFTKVRGVKRIRYPCNLNYKLKILINLTWLVRTQV